MTSITYMTSRFNPGRRWQTTGLLLVWILAAAARAGQEEKKLPATDPALLVQRAAENEVAALKDPVECEFQERLEWTWGTETRAVIETLEGRADRIVAFDDEPLAPDQVAKQDHRLTKLLKDRNARKRELEEQKAEMRRRVRMMEAFPQALLFEAAGEGPSGTLRFSFRPNPAFSPRDRETQVYRGMQGTVWVDAQQERIVRIEGVLTRDVSFGWGILGKLHKGGRYEVAQEQVSAGVWRIIRLDLDLKGRVFLGGFRLLRKEHNAQFERTPGEMTYREAVEVLIHFPAGPVKARNPDRPGL
ncbi:MAG TPA: hypothetical protein VF532_07020 [Candidatus Angelobacter sp.]